MNRRNDEAQLQCEVPPQGANARQQLATLRLVDQVALLAALGDGVFDDVAAGKVAEARQRIAAELDAHAPETVAAVTRTGTCDEAGRARLIEAVRALVRAGAS